MILKDGFIIALKFESPVSQQYEAGGLEVQNIRLYTTLPHNHYTNTVFLFAHPSLRRPHFFCEVSPSFPWGEYVPGNVFP
jgi:hypothetical protein